MVSSLSSTLRRPWRLGRLLRFVAIPAVAGSVLGFVLLWFNGGERIESTSRYGNEGFADAVDRAAPAVVNISSERVIQHPLCELPAYRLWCERFLNRGRRRESSLGSGVAVREQGYILTNYHVIAAGDDIKVAFNDGREARANLVGADPGTDLAVLKVDGPLQTIRRTSSADIRVGDIVLAIGNPFGIGQAVSLGIVSAMGRYGIGPSAHDDFIQTDAAVNPGNSGGALVDRHGRLVGINTLIYSRSGGSDGVGFAIPVDRAIAVLDQIIEHGQRLHGWLGIALSEAPADDVKEGLNIVRVYRGTPAHKAGLRPGDLLLSINGQPATTADAVVHQIQRTEPGTRLSIRFMRNGAVRMVEATAGARSEAAD